MSADRVTTPDWLLRQPVGLCPCGCVGRRSKVSFVEKTLVGSSDLMRQVMFSEDVARLPGPLQRLDARIKIVAMVVLLVAVGLAHNVETLVAAYLLTLMLAWTSRVPLGFFIKRVWLFIPVFTAIVVIPAMFSVVNAGDVVVQLWSWHGQPEGLTSQGLRSAALIVTRVAVSVSLAVLLTVTTAWTRLLAGLRGLGVPRVFVLIINMAYRYIFLLLDAVSEMYESRKARRVTTIKHDAGGRSTVGATAGAVVGKAGHLAEEVHQAMVARGYRGEAYTLSQPRLRRGDVVALLVAVCIGLVIYGGDRFLGR